MTELRRATQGEIEKNKRWDRSGLWEVEYKIAHAWLEEKAAVHNGSGLDSPRSNGDSEASQIHGFFVDKGMRDERILVRAHLGKQKEEAPNASLVAATGILKWIALLSEVGLFLFMAVMGFGSYVLIVLGVLLALSGYALGSGIGHLIISFDEGKGAKTSKGWMYLALGIIGTAGISYVRAAGLDTDRVPAVVVPVIVALTIALFEAMHMALTFRIDKLLKEVFQAQGWYSSDQFEKDFQSGIWKQIYQGYVAKFGPGGDPSTTAKTGEPSPDAAGPKRVAG